jgi:hypothetical protein
MAIHYHSGRPSNRADVTGPLSRTERLGEHLTLAHTVTVLDASPVTFFVAPDQGVVVARSGMTSAPSRRHDPGGGVTGPGASRDR